MKKYIEKIKMIALYYLLESCFKINVTSDSLGAFYLTL